MAMKKESNDLEASFFEDYLTGQKTLQSHACKYDYHW